MPIPNVVNLHSSKFEVWKRVILAFFSLSHRIFDVRWTLPRQEISKDAAYQTIFDELMLDGNPRLDLASFCTTWMEPECDKLILASLNKNYIDMDEYPITTELQVNSNALVRRTLD